MEKDGLLASSPDPRPSRLDPRAPWLEGRCRGRGGSGRCGGGGRCREGAWPGTHVAAHCARVAVPSGARSTPWRGGGAAGLEGGGEGRGAAGAKGEGKGALSD